MLQRIPELILCSAITLCSCACTKSAPDTMADALEELAETIGKEGITAEEATAAYNKAADALDKVVAQVKADEEGAREAFAGFNHSARDKALGAKLSPDLFAQAVIPGDENVVKAYNRFTQSFFQLAVLISKPS